MTNKLVTILIVVCILVATVQSAPYCDENERVCKRVAIRFRDDGVPYTTTCYVATDDSPTDKIDCDPANTGSLNQGCGTNTLCIN